MLNPMPAFSGSVIEFCTQDLVTKHITAGLYEHPEPVVIITILKGAVNFSQLYTQKLKNPKVIMEYIKINSYEGTTTPQHDPSITYLFPVEKLRGKRVLVLDDVLDTGNTLESLHHRLKTFTKDIHFAVLVKKTGVENQKNIPNLTHVFTSPAGQFLVGFGMDLDEQYRNLAGIHVLETGKQFSLN